MMLTALSLDEERDPLKALYILLVICELKLEPPGRAGRGGGPAARRWCRCRPSDLPRPAVDKHVDKASFGAATTELQVDSDPANAQVAVNLHGDGVTPRTLKVAPGLVFVEVQKEGYKKAFRAVEIDRPPGAHGAAAGAARAGPHRAGRELQLRFLQSERRAEDRTGTLSRLSQLARVETLVLLQVNGDRVKISFFDAERGALAEAPHRVALRSAPPAGWRRWPSAPPARRRPAAGAGARAAAAAARCRRTAAATPARPSAGRRAARPPTGAAPPGDGRRAASGLPEAQAAKQTGRLHPPPQAPRRPLVVVGDRRRRGGRLPHLHVRRPPRDLRHRSTSAPSWPGGQ